MFDILVADKLAAEGLAILKAQPDVKLTIQEKWAPGGTRRRPRQL